MHFYVQDLQNLFLTHLYESNMNSNVVSALLTLSIKHEAQLQNRTMGLFSMQYYNTDV